LYGWQRGTGPWGAAYQAGPVTDEQQIEMLSAQAEAMQKTLGKVNQRLESLRNKKGA
jgi:hypothetical protein